MIQEAETAVRRFVARQPIFDQRLQLYGYELLYRSGPANRFDADDIHKASCEVIAGGTLLQDLHVLTAGKMAWINVTKNTLIDGYVRLLPPDSVVIELLETIEPDEEVVDACRELREEGYRFALDDFIDRPGMEPLIELADFIKVDFLAGDESRAVELADQLRDMGVKLLAEKVESHDVVEAAKGSGYTLFQGFFFAKPMMVSGKDLPANQAHLLHILNEIHRPEVDFDRLEEVIRQDVALSYRLLRYINAACRGLRYQVSSIRQGIVLLGIRDVVRWASLSVMTMVAQDRMPELLTQGLVRAKFCESLGKAFGLDRDNDLFLLGLFSVIDAVLERPMAEIVAPLPIAEDTKAALCGESNPLRGVLEFCECYERAGWSEGTLPDARADEAQIAESYLGAVEWSSRIGAS